MLNVSQLHLRLLTNTPQVVNLIRSLVKKELLPQKFHAIFPVCFPSQAFGVAWAEAGTVDIPMMRSFKQLSIVPFIRTTYFFTGSYWKLKEDFEN